MKRYASSKASCATVTSFGVVTARKAGKATITVTTANKKKAKIVIQVVDPSAPTKVALNKTGAVKLKKGKTLQLAATLSPDTATSALTWTSSNKKIAKVSKSGKVTALKTGTATITVKTRNGKAAKVKIKVVK